MPYCPSCGTEYVDGAVVCTDCQGSLMAGSLPDSADDAELVGWVEVVGVPNQVAGVMLRGVLEASDIPVRVEEHTIPAYGAVPSSWNADSWGAILVPAEHLDAASELVQEYVDSLTDAPSDDVGEPDRPEPDASPDDTDHGDDDR